MSRQYQDRPNSSQLIDLAVYIVPPDLWREQLHSAQSQSIPETISAGFIRVVPDLLVSNLRRELEIQLGDEQILPREYVFLKNVGRCLTKVRGKQEAQLKVKNFVPPQSYIPEIFLLEAAQDYRSSVESSQSSTYRADSRQQDPYQLGSYRDKRDTFSNHKTVPPIQSDDDRSINSPPSIYLIRDPEKNKTNSSLLSYKSLSASKPLPAISDNNKAIQVEFEQAEQRSANQTPVPVEEKEPSIHSPLPAGRDDMRLPLSATPPHSPAPGQHTGEQGSARRPPLSATPPVSPGHQRRTAKYSNDSNKDSGIGSEDAERRRMEEMQRKQLEDEERRRQQLRESERRQQQMREEEERRRKEREAEQQRLREEEESHRRAEARRQEERRRQEELRRKEEEELRRQEELRRREEERRRPPADAPRHEAAPNARKVRDAGAYDDRRERETPSPDASQQSHRGQRKEISEQEKQELLEELEHLRQDRYEAERRREELVKRAKQLQGKSQNKRNQARDIWKKKYFEEKKKTPPLEEQCNKLRQELDQLHRKIMSTLEGTKDRDGRRHPPDKPSMQSNLKIQATRLQHEIEDLQRRVDNIKMKLTAEMKLRNQAETELRALRAELTQKKINVTLARSSQRDNMQDLSAYGATAQSSRT